MKKLFYFLIPILALFSCSRAPVFEVTEKEQNMITIFEKACDCKIRVEKDYGVITENKKNGELYIVFNYNIGKFNFCKADSAALIRFAKEISRNFQNVMDQKDSYKEVSVCYYSSNLSVPGMETPTCEKIFTFSINENKLVRYKKLGQAPEQIK